MKRGGYAFFPLIGNNLSLFSFDGNIITRHIFTLYNPLCKCKACIINKHVYNVIRRVDLQQTIKHHNYTEDSNACSKPFVPFITFTLQLKSRDSLLQLIVIKTC